MAIPSIAIDGIPLRPLLPGVTSFDVESTRSIDSTSSTSGKSSCTEDSMSAVSDSSSTLKVPAITPTPPQLPKFLELTSLSDDVFGAEPKSHPTPAPTPNAIPQTPKQTPFSPLIPIDVATYSTKSLPNPTPATVFRTVRERKTQSVTYGAPIFIPYPTTDATARPVSRAASVSDSIFSFAPSVQEKEVIETSWKARTHKRHTMDLQALMDNRVSAFGARAKKGSKGSGDGVQRGVRGGPVRRGAVKRQSRLMLEGEVEEICMSGFGYGK